MHSRFGNAADRNRRLPPPRVLPGLIQQGDLPQPRPSTPDPTVYPRETFAPIQLDPAVQRHLKPVKYEGESRLQGRVNTVEGWEQWDMARRLAFLRSFTKDTARDPAIASKAAGIIRSVGKGSRDHQAQWGALLKWVQTNILYVNEPNERIQSPQFTLTEKLGDCLPEETPLLTEDFRFVHIKNVEPGMKVWGKDRWSTVEAVVAKGELEVDAITLNNGSTFRATPGHKVYVYSCEKHGPCCPDLTQGYHNCANYGRKYEVVRIPVSDLVEGMQMLTPERLPFGTGQQNPDEAYVDGLYLADGWSDSSPTRLDGGDTSRFSISGKDGHPKEAQKREVEAICAKKGIETRWHARYIAVNDDRWAKRLAAMGKHAPEKRAATINLDEAAATALLRGLMADSGANTSGGGSESDGGRTYSSTSPVMAMQTRMLHKMQGRTCSYRYLEDHGGLGKHPIIRLGVRLKGEERPMAEKRLRVKRIVRGIATVPCYDIQTDDHYVYLPEADVTVSNCDDLAIVLAALGESIRLPWRFVISGRSNKGERIRFIEGSGPVPQNVQWSHIYLVIGWPPFQPAKWMFAEPTLDVPLGWDTIAGRAPKGRADMAGRELAGPAGGSNLALTAPETLAAKREAEASLKEAEEESFLVKAKKNVPWWNVVGIVTASVVSAFIVKGVVEPRFSKPATIKNPAKKRNEKKHKRSCRSCGR